MKKTILGILALATVAGAGAANKAFYIKKGDTITKYSFGVAEALNFSNDGKTLSVTGYNEVIDMEGVDHIYFEAPVDLTALTPSSQKAKLVEIGEELNALVDLYKVPELLNMWHYFFDHIDDVCPPSEYEVPEEYYDVHKSVKGLLNAMRGLADGSPAAVRSMRANAVDLYRLEDYFGVYWADRDSRTWQRTSRPDYLEIQFYSGSNIRYFVRLEASADFTTWDTKDFKGQLPKVMDLTFGQGDKTYATARITSQLVQDKSIDMLVEFRTSDYGVENKLHVTNGKIEDDVTVTVGKDTVVTAHSVVNGQNLVDYDSMYSDIRESSHYHDEDGNCMGENPYPLMAHFFRGSAKADILGKLQVDGAAAGLTPLYDVLDEDSYAYDELVDGDRRIWTEGKIISDSNGRITVTRIDKGIVDRQISALGNYTDARFRYDGTPTTQGYLDWDIEEDYYDYQPDYWFWDVEGQKTSGYIVKDGFLIGVHRMYQDIYNPDTDRYEYVFGDWTYSCNLWNEQDGYYGYEEVTVDGSAVIWPEVVRTMHYEVMPVLTFPDGTGFSFEDFFDEFSFKKLIDDYDNIISTYLKITGQD